MAPGGPWDAFPRPEKSKWWHGDLFHNISDLWIIFDKFFVWQSIDVSRRSSFMTVSDPLLRRPAVHVNEENSPTVSLL